MLGSSSSSVPSRTATNTAWPSLAIAGNVSALLAAMRISGHGFWYGFGVSATFSKL